MTYWNILKTMQAYRSLTDQVSLPFFHNRSCCWFYYTSHGNEEENCLTVDVSEIACYQNGTLKRLPMHKTFNCPIVDELIGDDDEYYDYFEGLLSRHQDISTISEEEVLSEIDKVQPSHFIQIYLNIKKQISEHTREMKNMNENEKITTETVEETVLFETANETTQPLTPPEVENTTETPTQEAPKETAQPQEATEATSEKLEEIKGMLVNLQECFDDKIAEDAHKNQLFDNIHRELTKYQNGLLDKIIDTMALDIIQLVDATKRNCTIYGEKEPNEENYKKLMRTLKGVVEDLEDILYRQDIESYSVPGNEVDVKKQKIIQLLDTDQPEMDNKIAERCAAGYSKGDKVLRPERIKIYKFRPTEN